jgi:lactoylglutathione lyase
MMKFLGFRLLVNDFPAAFKFWRDAMKLTPSFSDEGMGYAYFDTGNGGLELMRREWFSSAIGEAVPTPLGRETVMLITVDDVDASYADLIKQGAKPVLAPADHPEFGARTANLTDPDGHLIEIYTKLPQPATID